MTVRFTSDLHIGHEKMVTIFKDVNGNPVRNFTSVEEADRAIIDGWNSVVQDDDTTYVLGDVVINSRNLPRVGELKGRKILVGGNHDKENAAIFLMYFNDIVGATEHKGYILTHFPVHLESVYPRYKGNIHGHLHNNVVNHPAYINVGVEQVNYIPRTLEELERRKAVNEQLFIQTSQVNNWHLNNI